MQDRESIVVQFVKSTDGEVTAVFLDTARRNHGSQTFMTCYCHVGQHSECSSRWVAEQQPASEDEYQDLLEELGRIGYDVTVKGFSFKNA